MKNLIEKSLSSEDVYKGVLLNIKKDIVELPNGKTSVREYVLHPGAVVVVAFLPNGNIFLERQFRFPSKEVFIELPAGKIDPGETLDTTASRELAEETGYYPNKLEYIGKLLPGIGYTNEIIHIYKADDLEKREVKCDDDEFLEIFDVPFEEAFEMVMSGKIVDAKSMIAIFMMKEKFSQKDTKLPQN
ncbi:MAG: NUDIX hydrolase [Candidatus Marinimicrobia bacterium]|nr:NUDIX hydrolase [Candidatus Neomarinimicrobiota bacterium]